MKSEVFDDWQSIGHFLLGVSSVFLPQIFFIFLAYELIEFCFKKKKKREKAQDFIGDLLEFTFGAGLTAISLDLSCLKLVFP